MSQITVCCVLKSGGVYTAEYVERLKAGVDQHLSCDFVCLSDMDVPCEKIELAKGWPGWFSKIEIFRLKGKVLYFDLDTVITGDLTDIAEYPHQFTMLSDFYRPEYPASGVMAWDGDYSYLYEEMTNEDVTRGWKDPIGDAGYVCSKIEPDRFQNLLPGQITSRKVKATRNPNERVVCFHGQPRPHTVGWKI